ncbi:MAG: V-type ATP synthase subunit K [Caldicoprobacterales bacterium]|jgi:V/A-type H+-transporting ATPase subunit K|nr:V-type ATP synthase subunit K [Clostridiales bacterium]
MELGHVLAISGGALAVILAGIGSVLGVATAGQSAAGVVAEDPDKFGSVLLLQALPGTQGIYGMLIAFILMGKIGLLGGSPADLTTAQGWQLFAACMPIAILGLLSAIWQGKTASAAIAMVAKRGETAGKGLTMTVMVETYAVLALLASILMINGIQI